MPRLPRLQSSLEQTVDELRQWRWRWLLLVPAVVFWFSVMDLFYLAAVWPDWEQIGRGPIPASRFINEHRHRAASDRKVPRLRWRPVPMRTLPEHVQRAFIIAEDARFYSHSGIDLVAVGHAIDTNLDEGRVVVGASTISQQTVKNLFLTRRRSLLRKWHELVLTWSMERNVSKQRILSLYLNTAELGPGVFGVEAAARAYWSKSASKLTAAEAAALAATLPSPVKHNPATRTAAFRRRLAKVTRHMRQVGWGVRADASKQVERASNDNGTQTAPVAESSQQPAADVLRLAPAAGRAQTEAPEQPSPAPAAEPDTDLAPAAELDTDPAPAAEPDTDSALPAEPDTDPAPAVEPDSGPAATDRPDPGREAARVPAP
jgi:monofunctional biosynthetic peptidoglycan transglycosylase